MPRMPCGRLPLQATPLADRHVRRPAVFADRDGTIIRERPYLSDPAGVDLLPGSAHGLAAFHAAGFAIVIVTNQSGIARGYYDEEAYEAVQRELVLRLAGAGVPVAASYHCPHHPDYTGACLCRKPATGLFERAAHELALDLARSVFIGDRLRDVEPAERFGGTGFLVRTGHGSAEARRAGAWVPICDDLAHAARMILASVDTPDGPG